MMRYTNICPRCGGNFETLKSYAHCSSCLYYEDYWSDSESDFYQAMKTAKEVAQFQEVTFKKEKQEAHED